MRSGRPLCRLRAGLASAVLIAAPAHADARANGPDEAVRFVESLPPYRPTERVSGTIRIWGHGSTKRDFMGRLFQYWSEGFRKHHPEARLENRMHGTASAIGALYAGVGDLAILGEEIHPSQAAAFERVMGYPPFGVEIATGSLETRNFDYAHVFFVHADNPLSRLTLAQLDAIFGFEHRRGPGNIRTWGELGLAGEWGNRRIQPYGWRLDDDFALFLQEALLCGSHRWNNDLLEFAHIGRPDGSIYDNGQQILDALARDRYGIAVSNLRYAGPQVKPLAVARDDGGPFYEARKETLIARTYPFARIIPAFVNRPPGRPLEPKVREFLRYLLSREGQQDIVREGGYLPLGERWIREHLKRLE
jgi:phosphate transport system substrate-binding protein